MIVQSRDESWGRRLLHYHGSALSRVRGRLAVVTLIALVITLYSQMELGEGPLDLQIAPFSLIGIALGIFLGFRNNAAYDRYWDCLLYTSPSPRDQRGSRMPSSA